MRSRFLLLVLLMAPLLVPVTARADVASLRKEPGIQFTFALSTGIGLLEQETVTDGAQSGIGLGVGLGFVVHRRATLRLRLSYLTSATYVGPQSRDLSLLFLGTSFQWWAHDWAILEVGYGALHATQSVPTAQWDVEVEDQEANGWLFSAAIPLAQFESHFYQVVAEASVGGVDMNAVQLAWQWQWR